jgi:predicted AlkP superfamily phosphohydrolase/phosphomutase
MRPLRHLACVILISWITAGCRSEPSLTAEMPLLPNSTSTIAATVFPTPSPEPTFTPAPTIPPDPPRILLVSLPGARADWLNAWMDEGTMAAYAALYERSLATTVQGIDPATTAVSHHSLATGSAPAHTGIAGERVHNPADGFYWYTSAFELPMEGGAVPLWQAASQQGKSTAVLFWPGATPEMPEQLADYTVGYGIRDAYSDVDTVYLYTANPWENAPESFSPAQENQVIITGDNRVKWVVYILGVDSSDDGVDQPDRFILSTDRSVDESDPAVPVGEFAPLQLDAATGQGVDLLITHQDGTALTVFESRVYHITAAPADFQQALIDQFKFFAPDPDYYALEHNWITPDQYLDMVRRQSDWMMDVTLWVDQTYKPDLLLTFQNPLEQASYQFLLTDPRQPGYSDARAAEYHGYLSEAAAQADKAVGALTDANRTDLEAGTTALIVVGTTSLMPMHTQVHVNRALYEAGLLGLGRNGFVFVESSQAIAFSSGGSAHVYINLAGRELVGMVPEDQYNEVQAQIVAVLSNLVDPQTGEAILSRILLSDELDTLGLNGRFAGDIFIQAKPGFFLSDDRRATTIFEPVTFFGQQGYDSTLPEMQGVLLIYGQGIHVDGSGTIRLIDIAPSLADLLGISFDTADGELRFTR